jgi:hypothetical protein
MNRKKGFGTNIRYLWQTHGKEMANQLLLDSIMVDEGLINRDWMVRHLQRLKVVEDYRYISKFLQLMALELWLRQQLKK